MAKSPESSTLKPSEKALDGTDWPFDGLQEPAASHDHLVEAALERIKKTLPATEKESLEKWKKRIESRLDAFDAELARTRELINLVTGRITATKEQITNLLERTQR